MIEKIVSYSTCKHGSAIELPIPKRLYSQTYLNNKVKKGKEVVKMNGVDVHSFTTNKNRRWNCVKGWTI
jgi:hypothetical protein